jgi:glycerol-1-phosphate dehydrogenase [NAD(P)+]
MEIRKVRLPRSVTIGGNIVGKMGEVCSGIGYKGSVKVFTDQDVLEVAGKKVLESLDNWGYKTEYSLLPKIVDMSNINAIDSDFIIGVGGGRVIDFAKMTAKVSGKPFVSFPTAVSHDGISSDRAVIGNGYSMPAVMPDAIFIDTDIIAKSPYRLTASGCGDVIAKFTAIEDWRLSHAKTGEDISEYLATASEAGAECIIDCAISIRKLETSGIRNLIEALVFSGIAMSMAGSSRPASGSEHLFSHALKVLYPQKASLHGEECAVGAILCSCLQGKDWRRIANALKTIGLPTTSQELGIPKNIIIDALVKAKEVRYDRYTILNHKNVNAETAKAVAEETGVVQ